MSQLPNEYVPQNKNVFSIFIVRLNTSPATQHGSIYQRMILKLEESLLSAQEVEPARSMLYSLRNAFHLTISCKSAQAMLQFS